MKLLVTTGAASVAVVAVIAFVGSGYLQTRRVERKADQERAALHAMTQQDLAAAIARCDAMPGDDARREGSAQPEVYARRDVTGRDVKGPDVKGRDVKGGAAGRSAAAPGDAASCEAAAREMDNRPLELVEH